jgi:hypothetical protein
VLSQSSTSLSVSENSLATSIGIAAPVDTSFGSAALTVMVTALPSNGTILLADGVTPVNVGQSLTVQQLTALRFRLAPKASPLLCPIRPGPASAPQLR